MSAQKSFQIAICACALIVFPGCSAMKSLFIHPIQVLHAEHENVEQEKKQQRAYQKVGEEQAAEWAPESKPSPTR